LAAKVPLDLTDMTQADDTRPIRVLVVDDSAFMRTALSRMIACELGFEVAATACSGSDALDKIAALEPDVVTLDLEMPGLDGLQTLRRIMHQFLRPVIVVSAATEKEAPKTPSTRLRPELSTMSPSNCPLTRSTSST
jgi:chemotaxis response regulator CheB